MPVVRALMVGFVTIALVFTVAASHAAQPTVAQTLQQSENAIWARVPHCNCFSVGTSATTSVTNALTEANLTASLKELSPRDGWMYFVVNFDLDLATRDQVSAAIEAGGGELLDGPP